MWACGGFAVELEGDVLTVRASSGLWSMTYMAGCVPYALLPMLLGDRDEKVREFASGWIHLLYVMANAAPDAEFLLAATDVVGALVSRLDGMRAEASEADDAAALAVARAERDVVESTKAIEGGHEGAAREEG